LRDETGSSDFKNLDGARLKIWRVGVGGGDIGLAVLAVRQLKNTYIILLTFSCISRVSSESCPHNLCAKQIAPPVHSVATKHGSLERGGVIDLLRRRRRGGRRGGCLGL
jgi:hypothetical protein